MSFISLEPMPHTNITLGPGERALEDHLIMKGRVVLIVFSLVYLCLGVPGNLLTLAVLNRSNFRYNDISFYISAMTCVNLIIIALFMFIPFVNGVSGSPIENYSSLACFLTYWTFMTSLSINSWLLTPLTLSKIISKKHRIINSSTPHLALAIAIVFALCAVNSGLLAITRIGYQEQKYRKFIGCYQTRNLFILTLEVIFSSLLPFTLVVILFAYFFFMPDQESSAGDKSNRRSSRGSRMLSSTIDKRRKSSSVRGPLYKTAPALQHFVFLLDLQYAACVLPTSTFYFFLFTHDSVTIIDEAREKFALNLAMVVHYLNIVTNFVLFFFCDETFRKEVISLVSFYVTGRKMSLGSSIQNDMLGALEMDSIQNIGETLPSQIVAEDVPPEVKADGSVKSSTETLTMNLVTAGLVHLQNIAKSEVSLRSKESTIN